MARENLAQTHNLLELCKITNEEELVSARLSVRMHARDLKFSIVNQTKIVTAASELGRNVLEHGHGGSLQIDKVTDAAGHLGLRLTFQDFGPGIEDIQLALTDGYSSKKGLGLGLTGARRLMDEFDLHTSDNSGTKVVVTKWI